MNANYKQQAKLEAQELIAQGYGQESLVHFVEYPKDYYLYGEEYMYLSTPLPPDTNLSGHISIYYRLSELASLTK